MIVMPQVFQVAIAFASIIFILFPLGFIIKYYWPKLPWQLIPVFGMMVYGGIAVPILYLINRFSFVILDSVILFLIVFGIIFGILYFQKKTNLFLRWHDLSLVGLLMMLASAMIFSIAKLPVPGGIDSALHSLYITWIEIAGQLTAQYPLGMHTFILFFEGILHINRAYIMEGFSTFFFLNLFILIYALLKQISGKSIIGWLGIIAAVLDVSFYNNLLNGSLTHLLAVNLILGYLLYLEAWKKEATYVGNVILFILSVSVVYFHFITWYFLLPALWIHRLMTQRHRLQDLFTTAGVLVFSVPLILRLYDFPGYSEVFKWTIILIIGVELLLYLFGIHIYKIFHKQWLYFVLGGLIVFFLIYFRNTFDDVGQWYGWTVTGLAVIGLFYSTIKRERHWLPYMLLFSVYATLFALFTFSWANPITSKISLVKELFFYYGFTSSFIIFAAMGLCFFVLLGSSRRMQVLKIAIFSIGVILIFTSRISDKVLINSSAISRYNSNGGFGVFFQKNDVLLTDWFREYVEDDISFVANPGGLYGVWTSMVGHQTVYGAYGVVSIADAAEVNQEIINLMIDGESGRPEVLISHNVRYLFIPQAMEVGIAHPYLKLLKQIGAARLYQILDQPETIDRVVTMYSLITNSVPDIHLTGDYRYHSLYNGNRFYYQFQQVGLNMTVESGKEIQLKIDKSTMHRNLVMILRSRFESIEVSVNDIFVDAQRMKSGEIYAQTNIYSGEEAVVTVRNIGDTPIVISNIIVQLSQ